MLKNGFIKTDYLGAMASLLCLLHCIATPFVFVAKVCTRTCCSETPLWWMLIDYLFLIISFIAIYFASKNTSKQWIGIALWASWSVLLLIILNESVEIIALPEEAVYFPAFALIGLHIYNLRYCRCTDKGCCTE